MFRFLRGLRGLLCTLCSQGEVFNSHCLLVVFCESIVSIKVNRGSAVGVIAFEWMDSDRKSVV